ncbi:HPr(Ser) kinase/phosphatase [Solemya velesiana gill symbiont]|uniref:HPr kinase/phosphorylase n=1 Tax=Solemya velesiana gill symbiont TaxID=1918948 RepID=A0A1T2KVD8_9GAMM|nr:HPr(Ser) kinase/phosphatase [Solemya velesiana gill symbiont]OOZ36782.1 HPr(Ser) kinase/phosphatase [Solemya velesiana gill symbiont]
MNPSITTRDRYNALREKLGLEWIAGRGGSERLLQGGFPGSGSQGLASPLNYIHPNRIQIIGRAELIYFSGLDTDLYQDVLDKLFSATPATVILADGINVGEKFIDHTERTETLILRSSLPDARLLDELQYYLTNVMAERTTVHGVYMEVLGTGVLLTGPAAVGKSELALELISRGHRLIADDAPEFARITPDIIKGSCPPLLRDFLEVRGLGILNIRAMFGDSAVKFNKTIHLIINLKPMSEAELQDIDRLRGSHASRNLLGLQIPEVTLPVAPGREMGILVETAVRQHMLLRTGYDASEDFINKHQAILDDNGEE